MSSPMPLAATRRGFTLVELLAVVTLTTLGFVAIMNLQLGTVRGVGSARGMQGALELADHTAQTMRQEALRWTPTSGAPSTMADTLFLKHAPETTEVGSTSSWLVGYQEDGVVPPDLRVGTVGNSLTYSAGILGELGTNEKQFCVHYRLSWLVPDMLLRADIRISWVRPTVDFTTYAQCPAAMIDRLDEVQSVSVPVTILRNIFVRQV